VCTDVQRWQDQSVTPPTHTESESFPRRSAVTRGFRLGAPRSFTLSPDGARVVFLRSPAGDDPRNALWVMDVATGQERCLLDPATAGSDDTDLTPQERARRERVRETAGGIVTYSTDEAVTTALATIGSSTALVDLRSGRVELLDLGGVAVDARIDPTGRRMAFVRDGRLFVHDLTGLASTAPVALTPEENSDTVTWGLAEFVAAEEMGRTRGFWWSPDGGSLLVTRVDIAPVQTWWISDPATPAAEPQSQRYPAAGTANAVVTVHRVDLTGSITEIEWDRDLFEYLTRAGWDELGPWIQVQSRDQRRLRTLDIGSDGRAVPALTWTDPTWIELVDGSPQRHDGRWVHVADDAESDTRRVYVADEPLSPAGLQVRALVEVDDDGVVVAAAPASVDPLMSATQELVRVHWDGTTKTLGRKGGWSTGRVAGDTLLLLEQSLDDITTTVSVSTTKATNLIASHAERPGVTPTPRLIEVPGSPMRVAVLTPTGHDGTTPLPVLMDPYGGPHGQRVAAAGAAFTTAQWWADQGFVVVIADGRGTPGTPSWEKTVHLDLTVGVLDDQVTALQTVAAAMPTALDLSRVAIRGWSFGGYLAALAVLDRPDVFHAAVAGAPVTDWQLYDTHYTERYLGVPTADGSADSYLAGSLLSRASALTRPLLLIHGLADDNVVAAHTLQLSSALLAAGRPHQVLPLSGVTHMTPQEVVAENLLLLQRDFLLTQLPE
jgi:dipeptidyl-peptidase-4